MPLVINSLGADTQTRTHTDILTEKILRNQAHAWFKKQWVKNGNSICLLYICHVVYEEVCVYAKKNI